MTISNQQSPEPSHWESDSKHTISDWMYAVENDDTRLGYRDWVSAQRELHEPAVEHLSETPVKSWAELTGGFPEPKTYLVSFTQDGKDLGLSFAGRYAHARYLIAGWCFRFAVWLSTTGANRVTKSEGK